MRIEVRWGDPNSRRPLSRRRFELFLGLLVLPCAIAAGGAAVIARPGATGAPATLMGRAAPTTQEAEAIAARRRAVETGLLPQIVTGGEQGYDIHDRMAEYGVPGLGVAVINDGRIEWAAGYGVTQIREPDPVRASTRFQAASVSKAFTAVGVLREVEDERLDLDRDVADYLTSWTLPEGAQTPERRVTLRRLLSHSAGVNVHGFGGVPRGARLPSPAGVLEGRAGTDPIRVTQVPGEQFDYSGGGLQMVQVVLEDTAGEPFADFMRRNVIEPLGLEHSTFEQPLPDSLVEHAAVGHQRRDTIPRLWRDHPARAAAGLWSTPSDIARFALAIRASFLGDPDAVLYPETARAMLTAEAGGWGLGTPVSGAADSLSFGHGGNSPGYSAFFVLFPTVGDGVVLMSNDTRGGQLLMEVVRAVEHVYEWPGQEYAPRSNQPFARWLQGVLMWLGPLLLLSLGGWWCYSRNSREG